MSSDVECELNLELAIAVEDIKKEESDSEGEIASVSSTASDSPTPTNSTQDKTWVAAQWHHQIYEEQRQLLGTEEESSDRHSSSGEEMCSMDVWNITTEQREYYTNQFRTMEQDLQGLIPGPTAKHFFEKSRLPVPILSKIWQLSDVTRDGCLSLDEFCTAMHLVVLKRNNISLPDTLPPSLQPFNSKEWTRFVESPSSSASPVNFDFQKPSHDKDPKIVHPVAVRIEDDRKGSDPSIDSPKRVIQRPTPKKPTAPGPGAIPPPPRSLSGPPEDTVDSFSGPCSLPLGGVPPNKEPPPPPPPRPVRSASIPHHTRSSSLDLNKLVLGRGIAGAPPAIPPRVSPSTVSPRRLVGQRSDGDDSMLTSSREFIHDAVGAFQVYRKPSEEVLTSEAGEALKVSEDVSEVLSNARDRSKLLNHHHATLNHELSQLLEHKLQLQAQLHNLVHN